MAKFGFGKKLAQLFGVHKNTNQDFFEDLTDTLIEGDIGAKTAFEIAEKLEKICKEEKLTEEVEIKNELKELLLAHIKTCNFEIDKNQVSIYMLLGVNGVGKTTSIGKLAGQLKANGKKVLVAAADTFRAAAIEQLTEWANRAEVDIIAQKEGSDPAAVVFDAVTAAKARNVDVLLCDTAGRLHNKKNLMEELKKIDRVIEREYPGCHRETMVVLDGTTGQNAMVQAKEFNAAAAIDGIILTKLDGTAKGGIALAIQAELGVPVKYIGVGEHMEDLQKFDPDAFVDALFDGIAAEEGDRE